MNEWLQQNLLLMPNWKWAGLALAAVTGYFMLPIGSQVILFLKQRKKIGTSGHLILQHWMGLPVHKPLSWVLTTVFWLIALNALALPQTLHLFCAYFVKFILAVMLIRLCYLSVDAVGHWLSLKASQTTSALDDQIAPFAAKTLKVLVIVFGVLIALQNFDVNVMSLLAGLGLGGLALALAAQDTAANLFGSITILADRPFQIGDYIKIGDTEGNVEEIGFRSTRVRTFYNSLVTIPNSIMAKEKIDNLGARTARRLRHTFGFVYGTPAAQIKSFIDHLSYYLKQHPMVRNENVMVNFTALGDFSLQVEMTVHVIANDIAEENKVQEEILFEVMKMAEDLKLDFAFPTQTIHVPIKASAQMQVQPSPSQHGLAP
jgi:MscS family membrane protein